MRMFFRDKIEVEDGGGVKMRWWNGDPKRLEDIRVEGLDDRWCNPPDQIVK